MERQSVIELSVATAAGIICAAFWVIFNLIYGYVPAEEAVELTASWSLELPWASRWYDVPAVFLLAWVTAKLFTRADAWGTIREVFKCRVGIFAAVAILVGFMVGIVKGPIYGIALTIPVSAIFFVVIWSKEHGHRGDLATSYVFSVVFFWATSSVVSLTFGPTIGFARSAIIVVTLTVTTVILFIPAIFQKPYP